jgi:hypothetical protein
MAAARQTATPNNSFMQRHDAEVVMPNNVLLNNTGLPDLAVADETPAVFTPPHQHDNRQFLMMALQHAIPRPNVANPTFDGLYCSIALCPYVAREIQAMHKHRLRYHRTNG